MEKICIVKNKHPRFILGSRSKQNGTFLVQDVAWVYRCRVSFSAKRFQVALPGRVAENCLK